MIDYVETWDLFMKCIVLFWSLIFLSLVSYGVYCRIALHLEKRRQKKFIGNYLNPCPRYNGQIHHYHGLGGTGCPGCMGSRYSKQGRPEPDPDLRDLR